MRVTIPCARKEDGTPRRGQSIPGPAYGGRYADPPAAALLTGLGADEWSPLRSRHAPSDSCMRLVARRRLRRQPTMGLRNVLPGITVIRYPS